ncbi:MAG TPA: hypothetical protein VJ874_01940 [Candidatus Thermoplasmatota archaeon]|nr:hypothetical protein [Candidatus Thermoplasmatota archaeon]
MGVSAFLLAAAAPTAQAIPGYLELSGILETPVDVAALAVQSEEPSGQQGTSTSCGPSGFESDPAQRLFRFQDSADANGCLSVLLDVVLPSGARQVTVRFSADRVVEASGGVLGPPTLQQEVRLRFGSQPIASVPYFDMQDPGMPRTEFVLGFEAPAGAREVQLEWWFANRGPPTSATDPAGRLQAWSSTVRDPVVHLDHIPLPAPASQSLGGQVQDASYLAGYKAQVWVPAEHREAAQAGRFSLALHVPGAVLVEQFLAPDGKDLPADRYSIAEEGGRRTLVLPGSTLRELGPGPYGLQVQAAEALEVQSTMAALTMLALLMPPAALALAIQRLRQRIPEKYLESPADLEVESVAR